jgi:hypothetical protein
LPCLISVTVILRDLLLKIYLFGVRRKARPVAADEVGHPALPLPFFRLPPELEQIDEDPHLGPDDRGIEGLEDAVHRADGVAAEDIQIALDLGGHEDDGGMAGTLPLTDQGRRKSGKDSYRCHARDAKADP